MMVFSKYDEMMELINKYIRLLYDVYYNTELALRMKYFKSGFKAWMP